MGGALANLAGVPGRRGRCSAGVRGLTLWVQTLLLGKLHDITPWTSTDRTGTPGSQSSLESLDGVQPSPQPGHSSTHALNVNSFPSFFVSCPTCLSVDRKRGLVCMAWSADKQIRGAAGELWMGMEKMVG